MIQERMLELITMLLIENRCIIDDNGMFIEFIEKNHNVKAFNNRYKGLLDEFLKPYALNKTEKSEEHD